MSNCLFGTHRFNYPLSGSLSGYITCWNKSEKRKCRHKQWVSATQPHKDTKLEKEK